MLSGVGPADELKKHNIPLVHELPQLGKNLQDHCFSTATLLQKQGTNDRMTWETSPEQIAEAKAQHAKDKTGRMNEMYCSVPMGWFKNDAVLASEEYQALDARVQEHLKKPTVPMFEIATVRIYPLPPKDFEADP
jgi:choline dehydrogenase-like flavoprotein